MSQSHSTRSPDPSVLQDTPWIRSLLQGSSPGQTAAPPASSAHRNCEGSLDQLQSSPNQTPLHSYERWIAGNAYRENTAQGEVGGLQTHLLPKAPSAQKPWEELVGMKLSSTLPSAPAQAPGQQASEGRWTRSVAVPLQPDRSLGDFHRQNGELQHRVSELEERVRFHLSMREDAEQRAAGSEKKLVDVTEGLASSLGLSEKDPKNSLGNMILRVSKLREENLQQKATIGSLKEALDSQDLEFKTSRETILKLVGEVNQEQRAAASRAEELTALKRGRDEALAVKTALEREAKLLRERLEQSQKEWGQSHRELQAAAAQAEQLELSLQSQRCENRAARTLHSSFLHKLAGLLSDSVLAVPESEEAVIERVQELCSATRDWRQREEEYERRLQGMSRQLGQHCELYQQSVGHSQSTQELLRQHRDTLRHVEGSLAAKSMLNDGLSFEKQKHIMFVNEMAQKLNVEEEISGKPLQTQYNVLLSRAERLSSLGSQSISGCRELIHTLQHKVSSQKEKLDRKKAEIESLQQKLKLREEEKDLSALLLREKMGSRETVLQLERNIVMLQGQLSDLESTNRSLQAQLAEARLLQVKKDEKTRNMEGLKKSLSESRRLKELAEETVACVREDLQQESEERQRAQTTLQAMSNELRMTKRALREVARRERELVDFKECILKLLGLNVNTMVAQESDILAQLERRLRDSHGGDGGQVRRDRPPGGTAPSDPTPGRAQPKAPGLAPNPSATVQHVISARAALPASEW
uniref:Coiled-coil domain-containing protein 170-like n=1 Tax=Lepisosteus oculatus TaxID=7918 RepID=W5MW77_LEPOC|nr:PREDICTED: coiled-coil domain-containing protein 170-like isoform X1 [Lepisosteus oculatus]